MMFNLSIKAETVTYYVNDALGSPVATMNSNGTLDWKESYHPYGESRINPSQNEDDIGYSGHQKDSETGLTYMQARYYDPEVGRFYSNDPVGYAAKNPVMSFNRYMYVNNNPYKYKDPNGEWIQAAYGAVAGAVGGYVASGEGFTNTAVGVVSGLVAGAAVGLVAPQTSHFAGMAAAGMTASAAGQVVGSTSTAAIAKGIENVSLSDVKIDATTTVMGGIGSGVGNIVGKGVANLTMKPVVGQTLGQAGAPTSAGTLAGVVTEGVIVGVAEKVAPIIEKHGKENPIH